MTDDQSFTMSRGFVAHRCDVLSSANMSIRGCVNPNSGLSLAAIMSSTQHLRDKYAPEYYKTVQMSIFAPRRACAVASPCLATDGRTGDTKRWAEISA